MADTIFALASGPGRAAIAVVRISGSRAAEALRLFADGIPTARRATLKIIRDPQTREPLDRAVMLWFPGPRSFTGEDCAELHLHGGRAVVDGVLRALGRISGLRMALPGEFTRRAFLNDKMDLAEVEGLADLIEAQTAAQRRQALQQLDGALGRWVADRRHELVLALAAVEAAIDFADEPDVAGDFEAEVAHRVAALRDAIADELSRSSVAARVREGLVVAIAGPPNAGKSTLLNVLARREAAIVSPHAGTTRDPVEVQLDLDGFLVTCIDTAGLRETDDPVEREGIERARARIHAADLVLWLFDARSHAAPDPNLRARNIWTVATHADLVSGTPPADFVVAAPSGAGMPGLVAAIQAVAGQDRAGGEAGLVTRLRQRQALERALKALAPMTSGRAALGMEISAEHLRLATDSLDGLVGRIGTDEILSEIFARFCIGK